MDTTEFNRIEKLYHYTSFQSAYCILSSNTLLYGKLSNMNDINEAYRNVFYENEDISHDDVIKELGTYGQISLTVEGDCAGYAIPAMWGHYASKGCGVCFVFNKQLLQSCLPQEAMKGNVIYKSDYNGDIVVNASPICSFFKTHVKDLFFTKTEDWSYEQEFRILKKVQGTEKLDLKTSIVAIIISEVPNIENDVSVWQSTQVNILKKLCPDLPILQYSTWFGNKQLVDENGNDWSVTKEIKLDV